jgi:hypothetical protein
MRLPPSLRGALYAASGFLLASGVAWLVFRYLPAFRATSSSATALSMRIHGGAAMLVLLLTGSAVALHAPGAWRERRNRASGVAAGAVLLSLALTGYLLYYLGDDAQRLAASMAHWTIGLAAPVFLVVHVWLGGRSRP